MKKFLRDYFSFNRIELKGIRVLFILLLGLIVFYLLSPYIFRSKKNYDYSTYQADVDSFMAHAYVDTGIPNTYYNRKNAYTRSKQKQTSNFELKPFDPNGLPIEIWIEMGLTEKQAQMIKNYEAKGGRFRNKEDVKRQFVISDAFYNRIEPYLVFASLNDEIYEDHQSLSVDINHATQADWELLSGIGVKLAERIMKYREQLGGFYSVEQLKEVFGLKIETFEQIKPHCIVTPYSLRKININLADNNELYAHPYIGKLASKIINYRKQHGPFKTPDDFKNSGLVDEALYVKLVPYFSFTH